LRDEFKRVSVVRHDWNLAKYASMAQADKAWWTDRGGQPCFLCVLAGFLQRAAQFSEVDQNSLISPSCV
jgi:hypothetical protein